MIALQDEFAEVGTSEFDRQPAASTPVVAAPSHDINYLARDYGSFRQLMLDRLSLLLPEAELNPSGLGMAIVEALAYAADQLSYYQDAVATEAYLGTAQQRISVRRHARLIDYPLHEGCNARVWVQLQVAADKVELAQGTPLLTGRSGPTVIEPDAAYQQALSEGAEVFETLHKATLYPTHNEIKFHTQGATPFKLDKGATSAALQDGWAAPETIAGSGRPVSGLAFSSTGMLTAEYATSNGWRRKPLWQMSNPPSPEYLESPLGLTTIAFSPDGSQLAAVYTTPDGPDRILLWQTSDPNGPKEFYGPQGVTTVAFSPDGSQLAAGYTTPDGSSGIMLWHKSGPDDLMDLDRSLGLTTIAFSSDGLNLAAGYATPDQKSMILVWQTANPESPAESYGPRGVTTIALSSDGSTIAAGFATSDHESVILFWETSDPNNRWETEGPPGVTAIALSPDGSTLAAGFATSDHKSSIWVWTNFPANPRKFSGPPGVTTLSFSPDRLQLTAGYATPDGFGRKLLWQAFDENGPVEVESSLRLATIAISPDGLQLAAAYSMPDRPDVILFWQTSDPENPKQFDALPGRTTIAFSPDGSQLAVAYRVPDDPDIIVFWQTSDFPDSPIETEIPPGLGTTTIAFFLDGSQLAAGFAMPDELRDLIVLLQTPGFPESSQDFEVPASAIRSLAISSHNQLLAASSADGKVRLWNTVDRQLLRVFDGNAMAFSPDGVFLATGLDDGTVQLWRLGTRSLQLQKGDVLIFEEVIGVASGLAEDAKPAHRHAVRLTRVTPAIDPPGGVPDSPNPTPIVEIEWAEADALPFAFTVAARTRAGYRSDMSVARGNIVFADHGRTLQGVDLPPVTPTERYRPVLSQVDLTHGEPYSHERAQAQPAAQAMRQDQRAVVPAIRLYQDGLLPLGEAIAPSPWIPRQHLLDSGPQARDFVVEMESDRSAHLRFGDGRCGRQPTPGAAFTAIYEIGNGVRGNVGAEAISRVATTEKQITLVRNPLPARGGSDPELIEHARLVAPQAFKTQVRCVTAADYARMAEHYPSVRRATAEMRWTGSWGTVFVFVERHDELPVDNRFVEQMRAFLERYRQAGVDVAVRAPYAAPLYIAMTVQCRPGHLRRTVEQALRDRFSGGLTADGGRGFFHPDHFTLGQPLYSSPLIATAAQVAGVAWVELDNFGRLGSSDEETRAAGCIDIGAAELIQLGRLELTMEGGA